jgi:threonine synthase
MPSDLHCPSCETEYAAGIDEPYRCECGHTLELTDRPLPEGADGGVPYSKLDTRRGLWTFFEFLPMEQAVSFDEGFTPLVDAPEWDAQFKLEYVMPTGSFKDRGATTTLSRAVELGVETVVEDSSGNAGAAIATYAARAGIEADIYVPDDVATSKLMAIQRAGARPVRVEGSREDVTAACVEAAQEEGVWYASHAWNPAFLAGTQTFALEVAAQRDWSVPDAVVVPVGHGTLLLGAYRGFQALEDAGITDELPTLLAAQAKGFSPIADAFETDDPSGENVEEPTEGTRFDSIEFDTGSSMHQPKAVNEVADAIHISDPVRGEEIVEAIWATGGDAIAIEEDPVELVLDDLHRAGFYVEPTCAIGPAALEEYRTRGVVSGADDVVVALTGTGFKTH